MLDVEASLFELPESLSPREIWLREHKIRVEFIEINGEGFYEAYSSIDGSIDAIGGAIGGTSDEALIRLANRLCIKLWI
jgi:hypothetical protein